MRNEDLPGIRRFGLLYLLGKCMLLAPVVVPIEVQTRSGSAPKGGLQRSPLAELEERASIWATASCIVCATVSSPVTRSMFTATFCEVMKAEPNAIHQRRHCAASTHHAGPPKPPQPPAQVCSWPAALEWLGESSPPRAAAAHAQEAHLHRHVMLQPTWQDRKLARRCSAEFRCRGWKQRSARRSSSSAAGLDLCGWPVPEAAKRGAVLGALFDVATPPPRPLQQSSNGLVSLPGLRPSGSLSA